MLSAEGQKLIEGNLTLKAGYSIATNRGIQGGFKVGIGLMAKSKITPIDVKIVRNKLPVKERIGFDVAVSAHIGMVKHDGHVVRTMGNRERFGYYVTQGVKSAKEIKPKVLRVIATDDTAKKGAVRAVEQIKAQQSSFWTMFMNLLTATKTPKVITVIKPCPEIPGLNDGVSLEEESSDNGLEEHELTDGNDYVELDN